MDISFLKSNRFWALVVLAGVNILTAYGLIPADIASAFYVILGGHIGIKTIDRASEKLGKK